MLPVRTVGRVCLFVALLPLGGMAREHMLATYIERALQYNPGIVAAREAVGVALSEYHLAFTVPDPWAKGAYSISEVETRVGPQQARFGLSQLIPWPGKLLKLRQAERRELKAQRKQLLVVEAQVVARVRQVFSRLYRTGRTIVVNRQNLELLEYYESVLITRYATGEARQTALLKVQVEMARLDNRIRSLGAEGAAQREQLRELVDYRPGIAIPYPGGLPVLRVPYDSVGIVAALNEHSPAIHEARYSARAAAARVGVARQDYGPDAILMADYILTGEPQVTPPPSDGGKDAWIAGASISLPVWVGTKREQIRRAQSMSALAHARLEQTGNAVTASALALLERLADAERTIVLYKEVLVPKAEQTLGLVETDYRNAEATILDLIDAQRVLLDLQVELAVQLARREIVAAEIDRLVGGTLTRAQFER